MAISHSKCPTCGAELKWDPVAQCMKCEYCGSEFAPEDIENKQKENIQATDTDAAVATDETEGQKLVSYKCSYCGAEVITAEDTAATHCVYCHRPLVINSQLEGKFRPEQVLPFESTKEEAEQIFREYISKMKLAPADFKSEVNIKKIMGVYIPYWVYDCLAREQMSGKGIKISTWRDSSYSYEKRDTYEVERDGQMNFSNIPADASKKIDDAIVDSIEPFNFAKLRPFNENYLNGFLAQKYDVPFADIEDKVKSRAQNSLNQELSGTYNYDIFSLESQRFMFNDEAHRYVMLPVWLLYTEYKGKFYPFAMNGQTKKFTGNVPMDPMKVFLNIMGSVSVGIIASVAIQSIFMLF